MESVIFQFDPGFFDQAVINCETNPLTPMVLEHMPKKGLVLEAGCGVGNYVKYLSNQGYNIMGVEINKELVEAMNKAHPEMRIDYGNVNNFEYPDNMFDGMLSFGVVEHTVEGPQTALKEAYRVLKPGGLAIITVPLHNTVRKIKYLTGLAYVEHYARKLYYKLRGMNVDWLYVNSLPGKRKFIANRWPVVGNFFEYHFTPKEFNKYLKQAGFEIVTTLPLDPLGGLQFDFGSRLVKSYENPGRLAKILNKVFSVFPYFHQHMYFTLVRKPEK